MPVDPFAALRAELAHFGPDPDPDVGVTLPVREVRALLAERDRLRLTLGVCHGPLPGHAQLRIACAVSASGYATAYGRTEAGDSEAMDRAVDVQGDADTPWTECWVTADLPLPKTTEVRGMIRDAPVVREGTDAG